MQPKVNDSTDSPKRPTALITGASSGLGLALAHLLAKKKYRLLLTARKAPPIASEVFIPADLSVRKERAKIVELIHQYTPDLVINNAGFGLYGDAIDHSIDQELNLIELNASATVELSLEAAKALKKAQKRGTILNVASFVAYLTFPGFATYAATKRFVLNFSEALDFELKEHGIRILTACPGPMATSFDTRASEGFYKGKSNLYTLTPENAAECIWKQIVKQKTVAYIDARFRLPILLSRLLPKSLLNKLLRSSILKRVASQDT